MNPFLFSLNSVGPILIMILLGVVLRQFKQIDDHLAAKLNKLCFNVFIPFQIYKSAYQADLSAAFDLNVMLYIVLSICVIIALLCLIVPRILKDRNQIGSYIQGVFRGNIALIALSLMQEMYGDKGVQSISLVVIVNIVIANVAATAIFAYFAGDQKPAIKPLLKSIMMNPYLIAAFLGLITALIAPPIPTLVSKSISSIAAVGTPLALASLGATLNLKDLKTSGALSMSAALLRQLVIPAIVIPLAILLGFRNESLGIVLCMFAAPTAAGSYVLAKNMNSDHVLAGQILLMTTILSFFTMLVCITCLKALHFM